jgi:hypothetical protein
MVMEYAKRHADRVSGVSNVAYDLLATMTRKLEGIAALEEYILDASQAGDQEVMALFERIELRAREDVDRLRLLLLARLRADDERLFDTIALAQDELGD